jgi:hypothetical protein
LTAFTKLVNIAGTILDGTGSRDSNAKCHARLLGDVS